jgi:MATE family multidrug resistance protein
LVLGGLVMLLSATSFTLLRAQLPRLYTADEQVVLLAAQILPIAGAFQICDGTQVVAGGALRGMGRPDAAAVVNLLGYYVLALPLAYVLGFRLSGGLVAIWISLAAGLTVVAIALALWALRTARRPLEDVRVELEAAKHGP